MKIKLLAVVLVGMGLGACSDSPSRTQSADRYYQNDTYVDNHYTSNTVTTVNKTKIKNKILPAKPSKLASVKTKAKRLVKASTKTRSTRSTSSRRR